MPATTDRDDAQCQQRVLREAEAEDLHEADEQHQAEADRQRRRAPGVRDAHRRRRDERLVLRELVGGMDDEREEGDRRSDATRSRKARGRGLSLPTIAVMRMCSPRWNATIDPSIASQRNRIEPARRSTRAVGEAGSGSSPPSAAR
jgi:hypothetical protein